MQEIENASTLAPSLGNTAQKVKDVVERAAKAVDLNALAAAKQQPEKGESSSPEDLPRSGSPLPFLSAVGISSLVGGIYATVRTRHRRR